jgi:N-acetylmuramoyl-L-alanine amidase
VSETATSAPPSSGGGGGGGGQSHTAAEGDTLIGIAARYGFRTWETIWDHPNNASLREKRPDPQVLDAGDVVFIPPKTLRVFNIATNQRHVFKVKALTAHFRTQVKDNKGRPLADRQFQLVVEGEGFDPQTLGGFTTKDGVVELQIHPRATSGKLTVWMEGEQPISWKLMLGHLDPIETTRGVKARLTNLGFLCGPLDDDDQNEQYKQALSQFQLVHKLPVTGTADETTRQKLLFLHDRR